MAKYLVGTSDGTWNNFMDAYEAAEDGDTIEFEQGTNVTLNNFLVIDKNINFLGHLVNQEDGTVLYTNTIVGQFVIKEGKQVNFTGLYISNDTSNNAINIKDSANVVFTDVVIESNIDAETYPIIYTKNASLSYQGGEIRAKNVNTRLAFDVDSQVIIENIVINISVVIISSNVKLENINISRKSNHNIIKASSGSKVEFNRVTVEAEETPVDDNVPAIWIEQSELISTHSIISQCSFNESVCIINNSKFLSTGDDLTSIVIQDSRAILDKTKVRVAVDLENNSVLNVPTHLNMMGENSGYIDMFISHSVAYGQGKLTIHRSLTPNFKLLDSAVLQIKTIDYPEGDLEASQIKSDEDSQYFVSNFNSGTRVNQNENEGEELNKPYNAQEQLDQLIGLNRVKQEINKMISMAKFNRLRIQNGLEPQNQSFHSVFLGNPGTGKTTVARLIGQVLFDAGVFKDKEFKLIEASEPDFISSNVGGTAEKTLELLERARGGVLFIDEAYALNKKDSNVNFGIEAINTILKYMEDHRDELMIIFAGYTKEMEQFLKTNPGLSSRVANKFVFEDYSADEIIQMGEQLLSSQQYVLEDVSYYEGVVRRAYHIALDHSNARWIRNFNERLLKVLASRVIFEKSQNMQTINNVDIDEVMSQNKYSSVEGHNDDDAREKLQHLIGIQTVKEQVDKFIALVELNQKREEQGNTNGDFSLHSLFLGNPGTGKTTVARIVGKILYQKGIIAEEKFIEASRADFVASYVGQTAAKTREVLEASLGGVLFIDEAYTLNNGSQNDFGQEAIDEILKFMEDHRRDIVIIFAGYTKEMAEFLQTNSGLTSRIPNTFQFEDYTPDEIVKIGLLGLHAIDYQVDEEKYAELIKHNYAVMNDNSNGRWVRNINEQLIMVMSVRVSKTNAADINLIIQEDMDTIWDD